MKKNIKHPIKIIRERLGISQLELANAIGFKRATVVSNYETWYRSVDIKVAYKIIQYANSKDIKVKTTLEDIYPPDLYKNIKKARKPNRQVAFPG